MKSNKVFISHSGKDNLLATALCHYLESRNIRCWMAPRDIYVGKDYAQSIMEAIEDSAIMIVIFSAFANASKHVKNEVERAFNHQLIVMPFRIENVLPSRSLEYFLGSTHWLDAFDDKAEKYFEVLYKNCNTILNQQAENIPAEKITKPEIIPAKTTTSSFKNKPVKPLLIGLIIIIAVAAAAVFIYTGKKNVQAANTLHGSTDTIKQAAAEKDSSFTDKKQTHTVNHKQKKDSDLLKKTMAANNTSVLPNEITVSTSAKSSIKIPSAINGTYWQMDNADELNFSRSGDYALDFSGRIKGEFLSGTLVAITASGYKIISEKASGTLQFTNNYKNLSGKINFTSIHVSVNINLEKK